MLLCSARTLLEEHPFISRWQTGDGGKKSEAGTLHPNTLQLSKRSWRIVHDFSG